MKAAVCFKVVKELEKVLPSDWQSFEGEPDISYVGTLIGCYDEAALETALRLKDEDASAELTAITFGNLPNNHARRLFAAGFQNEVCLRSENTDFSPMETAEQLADWFRKNPQDLIICGSRTALNDSGSVPYYLASALNMPLVPDIISAEASEKGVLIKHRVSEGYCESEVKLPIILIAGSSTEPLRLTSLMAQIHAKKKAPTVIESGGVNKRDMKLLPREETSCEYPGLDASEAAEWLSGLLREAAK